MAQDDQSVLRHRAGNLEQENLALKNMLGKAANTLEEVVDTECSDTALADAQRTADRIKKITQP